MKTKGYKVGFGLIDCIILLQCVHFLYVFILYNRCNNEFFHVSNLGLCGPFRMGASKKNMILNLVGYGTGFRTARAVDLEIYIIKFETCKI